MVADIDSGYASSNPYGFTALGDGRVLFSANDGTHGSELWITDGTAAGTTLVADIYSTTKTYSSNPFEITPFGNGRFLFTADDGTHGRELWLTDGTAAGTALVADVIPGFDGSTPFGITDLGNGKALFAATDGSHGRELRATDGTAAGTTLIADINPGPASSYPGRQLTSLGNGKALFTANDGTHGNELWVTDGTAAGTVLLADINPGAYGSLPLEIHTLDNGISVFVANDGTHGWELWGTDGTAGGTALVADINPGLSSAFVQPHCSATHWGCSLPVTGCMGRSFG